MTERIQKEQSLMERFESQIRISGDEYSRKKKQLQKDLRFKTVLENFDKSNIETFLNQIIEINKD